MRTNDPSENDHDEQVQRVRVRRVGGRVKLRVPWRIWLILALMALAGLAVIALMVGLILVLLPWLLAAALVLITASWIRSLLAGRRRDQ